MVCINPFYVLRHLAVFENWLCQEESWKRDFEKVIIEKESWMGQPWKRNQGIIRDALRGHPGDIQEVPRRNQEAPRRHPSEEKSLPGGIQDSRRSRDQSGNTPLKCNAKVTLFANSSWWPQNLISESTSQLSWSAKLRFRNGRSPN